MPDQTFQEWWTANKDRLRDEAPGDGGRFGGWEFDADDEALEFIARSAWEAALGRRAGREEQG